MSPIINFAGERDFKLILPTGTYKLRVEKVELKISREKGTKYFQWFFKVVDGTHAGSDFISITTLKEGKRWMLRRLLRALGFQADGDQISFEEEAAIGREIIAEITEVDDAYKSDGSKKNEVKNYLPIA